MKALGTAPAFSSLRALFGAARSLVSARPAFREEMRQRGARALDALAGGTHELAEAFACDPKRAARYRDAGPDGLSAPWSMLAALPPARFQASLAFLQELHRELHGDAAAPPSREQCALVAIGALATLESSTTRALLGDMRIDDGEARAIVPEALKAHRTLRAYLVSLGVNPDDEGSAR